MSLGRAWKEAENCSPCNEEGFLVGAQRGRGGRRDVLSQEGCRQGPLLGGTCKKIWLPTVTSSSGQRNCLCELRFESRVEQGSCKSTSPRLTLSEQMRASGGKLQSPSKHSRLEGQRCAPNTVCLRSPHAPGLFPYLVVQMAP